MKMIKKRHPDALFQFKLGPAAAGVHGEQGVRVSLQQVEQQYQKAGTYRKDLKRKNKYSHVPTLLLYQQPIINFYPTPIHNTIAYQHNQTKEDEVPYSKERANFKFDMKIQGAKRDFKLNPQELFDVILPNHPSLAGLPPPESWLPMALPQEKVIHIDDYVMPTLNK